MFVFSDVYVSLLWGFPGDLVVKNPPVNAENTDDMGLIPGLLGRSPGVGNGNLFQYSCLEISMDRIAWHTTVHGVAEADMTEHAHHPLSIHHSFAL